MLLPFFDNWYEQKQLLLNNISKSLLGRLVNFNNLLANQSVVLIMDEAVLQQYTLSITDVPNKQPTYLNNINLVLPSIGFKSQVCKTEYPPLYNDVLPDHCIDIATCMINVSQLWQYEEETEKQHLLKEYKSINTSNSSSLAFTYNQKVWKFALVEGDEIGSMNYMIFNCIKMLIASQDSVTAANFDNKFIHYWFNHLCFHISGQGIHSVRSVICDIIDAFFLYYRNKFIELLCTDNPEPLKIREIFSFDKVSPKKPYLGIRAVTSPLQFLRLDEYYLPLVIIKESKLCFLNFDKFFCGLILAFDKLMRKNAVCIVKECNTTKLVNIDKFTVPRFISRASRYIPAATEILLYSHKINKILNTAINNLTPFRKADGQIFTHIKEEDRIVFMVKTEVRQLIYIGKTHNCRSIFNEMKKILTLTEQDYTDNPGKVRSLLLYKMFMQHTSTAECCFNIMKIYIKHIHNAIFYLCNKNCTPICSSKYLQYADFCEQITIELFRQRRKIAIGRHELEEFDNKIHRTLFNLFNYFDDCVCNLY